MTIRKNILTSFIALSLCVYFFFLMLAQPATPRYYDGNCTTAILFTRLSDYPITKQNYDLIGEFPIFATRPAGQMLTGALWQHFKNRAIKNPANAVKIWNGYRFGPLNISFGIYQSVWLALLFGLFMYYRPDDAVLLMFGTFCGMMFNLAPVIGSWWYPYDMPETVLFTWAILIFLKGEYWPLLAVIFLASVFKETGLVCALLVLLGPWSWQRNVFGFVGLFLAFYAVRKFLMIAGGAQGMILPFNEANDMHSWIVRAISQVKDNFKNLFDIRVNSPFFTGCGLLFVMLLLPGRFAVKVLIVAFMAGQFLGGIVSEVRDWFELLPLGLMQLSDWYKQPKEKL